MLKARVALLTSLLFASLIPGKDKHDPTTLVFPSFLHTLGIRKATKTHLMIYTRNQIKVRDPQGIAVVRLQSWDNPDDTKDDDEVTGYGVNSGANVIVYNTSMTSLAIYGAKETGVRALQRPMGVAANETGDVYLADTGNHRVVRFRNPGKNLEFVKAIGGKGALPGQFNRPQGVALDSQGKVYVCDTGNHRVQVLRPDDQLLFRFGKQGVEDGQLWHPASIEVTDQGQKWSYYKDDFIALIDLDNTRLQKFSLKGEPMAALRLRDFGYAEGHLAYLAIDYYSNIWVTDKHNHQIHKFDRDLNYLTSFGRKGGGDKEFNEPRGIAIRRRFGQLFVAEKESAQYYWIGTDIFDFQAKSLQNKRLIALSFFLTEPSFLTLEVEHKQSKEEVVAFTRKQYFSGSQTIYLDADLNRLPESVVNDANSHYRGKNGQPIQSGKYVFKLKIEPTYSSYQYFSKQVETEISVP